MGIFCQGLLRFPVCEIILKKNFESSRERMVSSQLAVRGIKDPKILDAMKKVPRHLFVPEDLLSHAYSDEPLAIGEGQSI